MQRTPALVLAAALALSACGGEEATDATSPVEASPTAAATTAAPTTSRAGTTAVTAARAEVTTTIDGADAELAAAIGAVFAEALVPGQNPPGSLPRGLREQFAARDPRPGPTLVEGAVTAGRILETDIAVFTSGDDVVLLAGQPGAPAGFPGVWDVVGAKLSSLGEPAWYGESPRLVLVLGSDARPGEKVTGFRADSVHIVGSVPATGEGSIVGIPRDAWVAASYGGNAKLTNTMASRGPEVVLATVQDLTGLRLEGFMVTGFQGFEDLIDAFGGFTIDVPYGMSDPKSNAYFSPGVQEFDGAEALAFSRNRTDTPNGDFGRSFNHGLVMLALLPEVQAMGVDELPALLEILTNYVITDLSAADLLGIAAAGYELDAEQVTNIVASGRVGSTSGGASVVFLQDAAFELFADVADGVIDGDY